MFTPINTRTDAREPTIINGQLPPILNGAPAQQAN